MTKTKLIEHALRLPAVDRLEIVEAPWASLGDAEVGIKDHLSAISEVGRDEDFERQKNTGRTGES